MKSFRTVIRPKVTTMPRNRTEASTQLEIYKIVTERQRIQREMHSIKERIIPLQNKLNVLNYQIAETEKNINQLRHNDSNFGQSVIHRNIFIESKNYQNFDMEY
ncbi:MAG: gas vesicle protein [Stigonema ocellatum SAG 48.90 = DSM 106950]|nr:gas vesicle protein [Stigonema ocellatum SAG 48.90 = DSM 106950]